MARMELDDVARISDEPVARVGSRFLPVPAALFPPLVVDEAGMVDLSVPAGTPVYATEAGRVTHAEGSSVGEVVVRGENGTRFHYRRMVPSSVAVSEGEAVDAGTVLGIVASSSSSSSLNFGIQHSDGTWQRAADALVGLPDPSELFLLPPMPGDAGLVSELPSQRRPARAASAPTRSAPAARPSSTPAPRPTVAPTPTPEPTPVRPAAVAPEPTPAQPAAVTPEPVEEPARAPAPPAAELTAADRLTRPRARPGAARSPRPDPAAATDTPAPPAPETEPPVDEPVVAATTPDVDQPEPTPTAEPDTVVMEPAPSPEPEPDESSSPAADDARVNALVGRRRRPRGNNR